MFNRTGCSVRGGKSETKSDCPSLSLSSERQQDSEAGVTLCPPHPVWDRGPEPDGVALSKASNPLLLFGHLERSISRLISQTVGTIDWFWIKFLTCHDSEDNALWWIILTCLLLETIWEINLSFTLKLSGRRNTFYSWKETFLLTKFSLIPKFLVNGL